MLGPQAFTDRIASNFCFRVYHVLSRKWPQDVNNENTDNAHYDSNMHIAPIRYVADHVGLVLCAHLKIFFFHEF